MQQRQSTGDYPMAGSLTPRIASLICLCVAAFGFGGPSANAEPARLTYEQHVRPILKAVCFQCHGEEEEPHGGLDVRLVRLLKAGGESGPAIVPGDSGSSLLWHRIDADVIGFEK